MSVKHGKKILELTKRYLDKEAEDDIGTYLAYKEFNMAEEYLLDGLDHLFATKQISEKVRKEAYLELGKDPSQLKLTKRSGRRF